MKGVQCYELFGGIALKIHTFSFHFFIFIDVNNSFKGVYSIVINVTFCVDSAKNEVPN